MKREAQRGRKTDEERHRDGERQADEESGTERQTDE